MNKIIMLKLQIKKNKRMCVWDVYIIDIKLKDLVLDLI